jgi:hypothetical protein
VRQAGYETAVADKLFGRRFVTAATDPYRIMRLKHEYIVCLPGAGRRGILSARKVSDR